MSNPFELFLAKALVALFLFAVLVAFWPQGRAR
jgi:hypothetical protein